MDSKNIESGKVVKYFNTLSVTGTKKEMWDERKEAEMCSNV